MTQDTASKKVSRISLESSRKKAIGSLWAVVICSAVNLIAEIAGLDFYFLFSASMPYYLPQFGAIYDAMLGLNILQTGAYILGAVLIAVYFFCGLLSRKKSGLLIIPFVLFIFDSAFLGYVILYTGNILSFALDFIFHIVVLVEIGMGMRAEFRLAALPPEEETPAAESVAGTADAFAPAGDIAPVSESTPADEAVPAAEQPEAQSEEVPEKAETDEEEADEESDEESDEDPDEESDEEADGADEPENE